MFRLPFDKKWTKKHRFFRQMISSMCQVLSNSLDAHCLSIAWPECDSPNVMAEKLYLFFIRKFKYTHQRFWVFSQVFNTSKRFMVPIRHFRAGMTSERTLKCHSPNVKKVAEFHTWFGKNAFLCILDQFTDGKYCWCVALRIGYRNESTFFPWRSLLIQ